MLQCDILLILKKKKVVERILEEGSVSGRSGYFKQYSILNFLLKSFPDENFWSAVKFEEPITSLYFFRTAYGHKLLSAKYKEFTYKPKNKKPPKIFDKTFGKDKNLTKDKKTTRNFLK